MELAHFDEIRRGFVYFFIFTQSVGLRIHCLYSQQKDKNPAPHRKKKWLSLVWH